MVSEVVYVAVIFLKEFPVSAKIKQVKSFSYGSLQISKMGGNVI